MTSFASIRTYALTFIVFYTVYLYSYKCHQKSFLERLTNPGPGQYVAHPFEPHQHQLCEALNTGSDYLSPYLAKAYDFVDSHVHSHPVAKKYQLKSKSSAASKHYHAHVAPHLHKLWQYVELLEYHVAVQLSKLIEFVTSQFHKNVVPKANEAKDSAAKQYESVKSSVAESVESVKEEVKDQIRSQVE